MWTHISVPFFHSVWQGQSGISAVDDTWNVLKPMAASEISAEQPASAFPSGSNDEHVVTSADSREDAASGSQNGMAGCQTDRFGFCGGHQYTDPNQYVDAYFLYFTVWISSDLKFAFIVQHVDLNWNQLNINSMWQYMHFDTCEKWSVMTCAYVLDHLTYFIRRAPIVLRIYENLINVCKCYF